MDKFRIIYQKGGEVKQWDTIRKKKQLLEGMMKSSSMIAV